MCLDRTIQGTNSPVNQKPRSLFTGYPETLMTRARSMLMEPEHAFVGTKS